MKPINLDYDQYKILQFLKDRQGNLCDYQRTHHPDHPADSIYKWMGYQPIEFRIQCRMYRNAPKSKRNEFHDDLESLLLIHEQKTWRQSIPEVVELIKGEMNNVY